MVIVMTSVMMMMRMMKMVVSGGHGAAFRPAMGGQGHDPWFWVKKQERGPSGVTVKAIYRGNGI